MSEALAPGELREAARLVRAQASAASASLHATTLNLAMKYGEEAWDPCDPLVIYAHTLEAKIARWDPIIDKLDRLAEEAAPT